MKRKTFSLIKNSSFQYLSEPSIEHLLGIKALESEWTENNKNPLETNAKETRLKNL